MELPRQERELFLRVGLVLNDLLLFQRLWAAFIYREPRTSLAKQAQAVHSAALLLIIGGKVFEACDIFEKRFLSSPVGRRYLPRFSRLHKDAVRYLRKRLGANTLLAKIRNRFAFHYHKDDLTPFVERMVPDHVFRIFLGEPDGNSLHPYSAEPFLFSLQATVGASTPAVTLKTIQDELGDVIQALYKWCAGVQVEALKKMVGPNPRLHAYEIYEHEYLPQDKIAFPFFMAVPAKYRRRKKLL